MSGVTDEGMEGAETVTVIVKFHESTLDALQRLANGTHRAPGNPTPDALVKWAVDSFIEMREVAK